ncbi:MAG: transposase, partial [Actinomycetota bacterium]|nr:transposase [Actinomycetota bacterium]
MHRDTVMACARTPDGDGRREEVVQFATTTAQLLVLSDWLLERRVSLVGMEATGVYWKPVHWVLEDAVDEVWVINARHMRNVPGRKTDVNDATWLADLMAHGLIRGSFVPDAHTQELRALLRTRKQFVRERSSHIQRLQKT